MINDIVRINEVEVRCNGFNADFLFMENPFEIILSRLDDLERQIKELKSNINIEQEEKDVFFDVKQTADFLGYTINTVRRKSSSMELPNIRKGGKLYYLKADLIAYLKSGRRKGLDDINNDVDEYIKNKDKKRGV